MCLSCCWTTPLTNGAINQTLRQFARLGDDRLLQLVDCHESSTLIGHLLKNIPNSIMTGFKSGLIGGPMPGSINVDHAIGQ